MHCDGRLWIVGEVQSSYWVACDTCDFAGKRWKMHVDPGLRLVIRK